MTLTREAYEALRAKCAVYDAALKEAFPEFYERGGCLTPEMAAKLPPRCSNEELSAMEVYRVREEKPDRVFAYVNREETAVTTWTGETLGRVSRRGHEFRGNLGDRRRWLRVLSVGGAEYAGCYSFSNGEYVILRKLKERPAAVRRGPGYPKARRKGARA